MTATPTRRGSLRLVALALGLVGLSLAVALPGAGARDARTLGKTRDTPAPNCPNNCFAVGSVSGFQTKADGRSGLFRMPVDGKIVAWSVDLARVRPDDRDFFGEIFRNDRFGKDPSARIGVLRKVDRKDFRLTAQSEPVNLSRHYGEQPVFTLDQPLPAPDGRLVALTIPTWIANLAVNPPGRNNWRASRRSGHCGSGEAADATPHQNVDTVREYGCAFTDRLLYWAYYVAS